MKKLFNKHKLIQLQHIKQKYKYIYIFRYSDLSISEFIQLKKQLHIFNCNFFFLKKTLLTNHFLNLKGQGSVLILYSNSYESLFFEKLKIFTKIEFLFLIHKNFFYSKFKILKILKNKKLLLNHSLFSCFFYIIFFLKKASIT